MAISINVNDIPMRDDSPPKVLARAAEHMAADGTPWLATLAHQLRAYASDAERGKVTIDLTAAYEECDAPQAVRGAYHVAREYLAAVEKRLDGEATS